MTRERESAAAASPSAPPGRSYPAAVAVKRTKAARAARKRKRRMDRVDHDLTDADWAWIQQEWGGCAYCGADGPGLQRDCVLPISRGGRYTIDNVVPACRSCNASKCNAEVTGWMRRKRLDESAFLLQLAEIRVAALERPQDPAPDPLAAEPDASPA